MVLGMKWSQATAWVVACATSAALLGLSSSPAEAAVVRVGGACHTIGATQKQGILTFQCQKKSNKLTWVSIKLQVSKKIPVPVVTADDFVLTYDGTDLTVTIPAINLHDITAEFHTTSFITRFVLANETITIPVSVSAGHLDADGALNIVNANAYFGTWSVQVAAVNVAGQGKWSSPQEFVIDPPAPSVIAPDYTVSYINGNLTATVAASDIQSSVTNYQTTSLIAQFTSPTGVVTTSSTSIQDASLDYSLWVSNPAPGTWSVSIAGINGSGQGDWSAPQQYVIAPQTVVSTASPTSQICGTTPTLAYQKPGWLTSTSPQLTTVRIAPDSLKATWCPASVISTGNGYGPIIYTVTVDPGGETCTTWTSNTCIINNVPSDALTTYIMATNEVGTTTDGIPTIANSGQIFDCVPNQTDCFPGPTDGVFQTYGNTFAGLGDCTFAAAADWEQLNLGVIPDAATVQAEFIDAGGSEISGLPVQDLFKYWHTQGIAGVVAKSVTKYYTDQIDVQNGVRDYGELVVSLTLAPDQNIAGQSSTGGGHMLVVDGFTPEGPIVVTWGATLQMTWQQWNLEVTGMWGINN